MVVCTARNPAVNPALSPVLVLTPHAGWLRAAPQEVRMMAVKEPDLAQDELFARRPAANELQAGLFE